MRWVVVLGLVAGCDRLFGLNDVDNLLDASSPIDATQTDGTRDAADDTVGCSSGVRAALLDTTTIAACSGSWTVPGLTNAAPLCASGWHICADGAQAAQNGLGGRCNTVPSATFFATLQGSSMTDICDGQGDNDIFGCGVDMGSTLDSSTCGGLDVALGTFAPNLGVWSMGSDPTHELSNVTKGPGNGGVLCCKDAMMN